MHRAGRGGVLSLFRRAALPARGVSSAHGCDNAACMHQRTDAALITRPARLYGLTYDKDVQCVAPEAAINSTRQCAIVFTHRRRTRHSRPGNPPRASAASTSTSHRCPPAHCYCSAQPLVYCTSCRSSSTQRHSSTCTVSIHSEYT
jgi:hypothetical protein